MLLMIHMFCEFYDLCHFSAIERNLESEEQERVSADMRIRKSQVNHVMLTSRVASRCFLHGTTFLIANNLEDSVIILSLTHHFFGLYLFFNYACCRHNYIWYKHCMMIQQSMQMHTNYRGQCWVWGGGGYKLCTCITHDHTALCVSFVVKSCLFFCTNKTHARKAGFLKWKWKTLCPNRLVFVQPA